MIIPLRTDSPLRHTPYMNWALIVINVVVFLLQQTNPALTLRFELSPHDPVLYCFITYAFLHAGPLHIIGNMLFLYIFGNNVNDKMGHLGYLAFYLAGGVFAGIGYVVSEGGYNPVVGASGAIAAVTGAYLILFPLSNVTIFYFFYLIGQYEIPSFWFILFFFGYDLVLNVAHQDNVAHAAHIGGTLFGIAVCFVMLMARLLPRDQFDVAALVQRWNRRRQYRDMVSRGYNPFGVAKAPNEPPPPPDPRTQQIMGMRAAISEALGRHDTATAAQLYLQLKQLDPQQVLSKQAQLDVANTLAGEQLYPQAAEAYELLLRTYPKAEQIEQVELMLGLIYARYLSQYHRAKEYLQKALTRLHGENEQALAREELARISPLVPPGV